MRDWRQVARDYDRFVFDLEATGPHRPLVWRVPEAPNLKVPGFGMPSFVGDERGRGRPGEALACIGSLLGATAAGIDKRSGAVDWVSLCEQYFNAKEGAVLNNAGGRSGGSFWYELLPSIVFTQLSSRYPGWTRGREMSREIADTWQRGLDLLGEDFDHTSLNFETGKPVDNGRWKEPDAAAAVAYLELLEGLRSENAVYLLNANRALGFLQKQEANPTYEILTAYGALAGAYLNAEKGAKWDVPRFVSWCFEPSSARPGWGMVTGRWGEYDAGGLMGSTTDTGGYAFAMNTFLNAATLAPLCRYDERFSAPIAKWILNLANASRLFYRNGLPETMQSSADWKEDVASCVAYEGLRREWNGISPYATGDARRSGWAAYDYGLYGAGYVGLLGALVRPTDVPMILRLDLRATDFLPVRAYPTDLLWNPYEDSKTVRLDMGVTPVRVYDSLANRLLTPKPVRGAFKLSMAGKDTVQLVRIPAKGAFAYAGRKTLVDGIVIDYDNGR